MKTITFSEATQAQLATFAHALGLEVNDTNSKSAIIGIIKSSGHDGDTLEVEDDKPKAVRKASKVDAPEVPERESDLVGLPVTILLPSDETAPDMEFIGVNGVGMYIQRGIPQTIKYEYFAVLEACKKTVYTATERDGLGDAKVIPGIPFQVLEMDPRIAAWRMKKAA
jgi:hypothetical protein